MGEGTEGTLRASGPDTVFKRNRFYISPGCPFVILKTETKMIPRSESQDSVPGPPQTGFKVELKFWTH